MNVKKVDILNRLHERLLEFSSSKGNEVSRALIYGLPVGFGAIESPVAVTVVNYYDQATLKLAARYLPSGLSLIGIVEFEGDEDQDVYASLDSVDYPILLKVIDEKISGSTGLDFLSPVNVNVVSEEFWEKNVCTFRLRGQILLSTLLEFPDLKDCFMLAKMIVTNQAAFSVGKKSLFTLLPPLGIIFSELKTIKPNSKVGDVIKALKKEVDERIQKTSTYFQPGLSLIDVKMLFDQTRPSSNNCAAVAIADKSACCKFFDHYVDMDVLVITPVALYVNELYETFIDAISGRLESGFHANIANQLVNSITAEKPEVFHFWPAFCKHFVSVLYPDNTSEEKLMEARLELHKLFFVRETRPYFRRSASLFQKMIGLVSPHVSLKGKYSETEYIKGHYEYRHYMQENFNDDGWGCAYRSLQTIVSWFRLQGFTSVRVPTHREIQECLVSLGDKPASFVGSKQWIGSTEVSFVLEALLGISCRILSLASGGEMTSRVSELQSHFRYHGTPVMIGGGVLAHTLIGASCDSDTDSNVNYLVLDPHYTGKDDIKTILSKGWVGWKDNNFWSKKDFYNMCMPLLPSAI